MTEERRRSPRGPFDPEDTDWGRKLEQRHIDNLVRFDKIEGELGKIDEHIRTDIDADIRLQRLVEERHAAVTKKLSDVEAHMALDLQEHTAMRSEMRANTALTQEVKADTATLRITGGRMTRLCDEWFGMPESSPGAKDGQDGVGKQIAKFLELRRLLILALGIGVSIVLATPGLIMLWDRMHGR